MSNEQNESDAKAHPVDTLVKCGDEVRSIKLTREELRECVPIIQDSWSVETACTWTGAFVNQETRSRMREIIANDSFAISFQTMGQYRSALLKMLTT